jgi:hypothetical protein
MSNRKNKTIETETSVTPYQTGGGVFSYLFGSDKGETTTELLFDAFEETRIEPVLFLLNNSLDKKYNLNYSKKSSSDKTILHYLIIYSNFFCSVKQLLFRFFNETNIKDSINEYDGKGNTAGHYALYFEMTDILDMLVKCGLDLSLKNCNGHSIDIVESDDDYEDGVSIVSISKSKPSATFQKILDQESNKDYSSSSNSSSELDSCRSRSAKSVASIVTNYIPQQSNTLDFVYDSELDELIEPSYVKKDLPRRSNSAVSILLDTLNKHTSVPDKIVMLTGGKKSKKINKLSESSELSQSTTDMSLFRMANEFENKASKAHENAVNRIKEILKVSDSEAKAYKAILYETIKKEQPELSNYDRAMELEKRASNVDELNNVNKTQLKEMIKIIEKRMAEKELKLSESSASSSSDLQETSKSSKSSKYKLSKKKNDSTDSTDKLSTETSETEKKKKNKKNKDLTSMSSKSSLSSLSSFSSLLSKSSEKKISGGKHVIKIDSSLLKITSDSGNSFFLQ